MKHSAKYLLLAFIGSLSLSSCTMGDKGSSKVADSVKIDTTQQPKQSEQTSDTTLIDKLQTDTGTKAKKP